MSPLVMSSLCYPPPQSWAAQSAKVSNGSDSENWRDRRGSASSSVPVSSSSSSSSSSSPSSPPTNFSSSTSSFPAFSSSATRSRDERPCKPHPCAPADRQQTASNNFLLRLLGDGFLSSSGYFEGFCASRRASTCSQHSLSPQITDDLPELLSQLGLIKYIDIFEQQEVILNSLSVELCSRL